MEETSTRERQRDLSLSHDKVGDVLEAQGDLAGALKSYRSALTIRERLAATNTANTTWQRDVQISHGRIGNIL